MGVDGWQTGSTGPATKSSGGSMDPRVVEGFGLIEGYGLGIEADGYAVDLNPLRL